MKWDAKYENETFEIRTISEGLGAIIRCTKNNPHKVDLFELNYSGEFFERTCSSIPEAIEIAESWT